MNGNKGGLGRGADRSTTYKGPTFSDTKIPQVHYSRAGIEASQKLAETAEEISMRIQDQLDVDAAHQARQEGIRDGSEGNIELQRYSTIRGREYNKAALSSYAIRVDMDASERIARLYEENSNDPASLQAAYEDYEKGVASTLKELDPESGLLFSQRFRAKAGTFIDRARDNQFTRMKEETEFLAHQHDVVMDRQIEAIGSDLFSDNPLRQNSAITALNQIRGDRAAIYNRTAPSTETFNFRPEVSEAIKVASAEHGVSEEFLSVIAKLESNGNPKAKNKNSTAAGLFQFIDDSAKEYGITDKFDPYQSANAAAAMMKDNMQGLTEALGRSPNVGELYLAHQQGLTGAVELLTNPEAKAVSIRGEKAVKLNGGDANMTAEEFASKWINKAQKALSSGKPIYSPVERLKAAQDFEDRAMKAAVTGWFSQQSPEARADALLRFTNGDMSVQLVDENGNMQSINFYDRMSDDVRQELMKDMKFRVDFEQGQEDRKEKLFEKQIQKEKRMTEFDYMMRINRPGEKDENGIFLDPVDGLDLNRAIADRRLDNRVGRSMIAALSVNRPDNSDQALINDLLLRMHDGEDIRESIISNMGKINRADFETLYTENNAMNVFQNSDMSNDQKFYFSKLKEQIFPDMLLQELDRFAPARLANAQIEYRKRIAEGEDAETVYFDLQERANREIAGQIGQKISGLIMPRFAILQEGRDDLIDIDATRANLYDQNKKGRLSDNAFARQLELVEDWERLTPMYLKRLNEVKNAR